VRLKPPIFPPDLDSSCSHIYRKKLHIAWGSESCSLVGDFHWSKCLGCFLWMCLDLAS
jgi:hypothetical protein